MQDNHTQSFEAPRRKFLAGIGTGVTAGLAGCGGSSNPSPDTASPTEMTTESTPTETDTPSPTPEDQVDRGGLPVMGMTSAPQSLNPLAGGTSYDTAVYEGIYTYGTRLHPETLDVIPWGFSDWELEVDNVGSSDPTIVAELQEGLSFSDGVPVTAEDIKFTIDYVVEQEPATEISASDFASVEEVTVDSLSGSTVNFFFNQRDNGWATDILGTIFLPKHVWENVPNYNNYDPLQNDGPIGSGPLTISDYVRSNWYELGLREADAIPWNETFDFLRDDGPFLDGVRFEIFGGATAMNQSLLSGDTDLPLSTVTVDRALTAQDNDNLTVIESESRGLRHISYNTRRVPLDDRAFRQALRLLLDDQWIVDTIYRGVGGGPGDYFAPKPYTEWRPPNPREIDEYEGINVPDLTFPGTRGENAVDQAAIDEARNFLINHPNAKHDYSVGEQRSDAVTSPDDQELYINGEPFATAHSDNAGDSGQGPMVISYNPPDQDAVEARIIQGWMQTLNRIGIPTTPRVESFNSQVKSIYVNENFDVYAMGFSELSPLVNYLAEELSSEGVDFEGTDQIFFNTMAYTNADDLIERQARMMSLESRKPIVKQVLAKVWRDQPRHASVYEKVLQPVSTKFEGYVQMAGGVSNLYSWLNMNLVA